MQEYTLSPQQKRIFELKNLGLISSKPNVVVIGIEGECSNFDIELAIKRLAEKYSALRTRIGVDPKYNLHLQQIDSAPNYRYKNVLTESIEKSRDLDERIRCEIDALVGDSLFEAVSIDISNDEKVLILAFNPQNSDIEPSIFLEELSVLMKVDIESKLLQEEVPYYAVSEWLNDLLTNDEYSEERSFWNNGRFYHYENQLSMIKNKKVEYFPSKAYTFEFPEDTWNGLNRLTEKYECSIDSVILSCWNVTLHVLGEEKELTIGIHTKGREDEELGKVVGPLNRFVPLYSNWQEADTFEKLISRTIVEMTDSQEYADYFDYHIFKRAKSSQKFFSYGFESQYRTTVQSGNNTFKVLFQSEVFEPFHLLLRIHHGQHNKILTLNYNSELFDQKHIEFLEDILIQICNKAYRDPKEQITSNIISDILKAPLLSILQGELVVNRVLSLVTLLEEQVLKTPDNIAVISEFSSLTFKEVHEKSNQLAHYLKHKTGVNKGDIVGVCMDRSLELVISLLAVLKAGAAYLPLDQDYPDDRLEFIYNDANTKTVILKNKNNPRFSSIFPNSVFLEEESVHINTHSNKLPEVELAPMDIAYMIYTSGSTGKPKGVKVPHKAICNHMNWMNSKFELNDGDSVLQKTSVSFDASVWEFYAPLTTGAKLVLAKPGMHTDPDYLLEVIKEQNITTLQVVPTMLQALVEKDLFSSLPLKRVFSGGERLTLPLQKAFFKKSNAQLINLYGPTEACIDTTYHICNEDDTFETIGKPIYNTNLFVLDEDLNLVPPGVAGELYIGGDGLALGYMNQKLNEEAFINNPFDEKTKIYRTGDLVRYYLDGQIGYIGRADSQIKLRGYRIELGEIEKVLSAHECVRYSAVKVFEKEDQLLVGYVELEKETDVGDIREFISLSLPEYMIPNLIQIVDKMPLLNNGKIDYHALTEANSTTIKYVAPMTTVEILMANIWESALKREKISIDDNFFAMGGHSLIATQVISEIRQQTGVILPLRKIFDAPTIRELSVVVENLILENSGVEVGNS